MTTGARRPQRPRRTGEPRSPASPSATKRERREASEEEVSDRPVAVATAQAASDLSDDERRRIRLVTMGGTGLFFAVAVLFAALEYGSAAVVLLLTGGALVAVVATFWGSIRALIGETKLSGADAFSIGAPRAEEEQKRAVLRALKDLEFERAVGKISDEDYGVLVARYRDDAKRLLRQIDQASADQRERAESAIQDRLKRAKLNVVASLLPKAEVEATPAFEPAPADEEAAVEPAAQEDESKEPTEAEDEPAAREDEASTEPTDADDDAKAEAEEEAEEEADEERREKGKRAPSDG